MDIHKCFEILKVTPDSSPSEMKQAYRDLANVWHPDRFSQNDRLRKKAEEELKNLNLAYQEILHFLSLEHERLKIRAEEEERLRREDGIRAKQEAEYRARAKAKAEARMREKGKAKSESDSDMDWENRILCGD